MSASNILFRLLLAVVLLSPAPLASNRPWAWSLLATLVAFLLICWAALAAVGRARAPAPFSRLWAIALPFALVLAWAFVQTLGLVSPSLWHPLWAEAAPALGIGEGGMISADPAMTQAAILRLATYGGVFWLAVQLGRDRARAREAATAVGVAGAGYAIYGLMVYFAGWDVILWLKKWSYHNDLTSTFVNRNAYGAYAGLGVLCCIGLFANALRPPRRDHERGAYDLAENMLLRAAPSLIGAVVIGWALLASHSRGAFLSTTLATTILLLMLAVAGAMRPRTALLSSLVVGLVGLTMLAVGGDATLGRLMEETSAKQEVGRTEAYRLSVEAINDAPLTGVGMGAFMPAFRVYRDATLSAPVVWEYAHNVHLETAMDLGLPAAGLLYFSFAVIIVGCLRGLRRRRRDHLYPALAVSSAILLGAHGLVDFSAQIPAVAATFALLLGIGYAQSWSTAGTDGTESGEAEPSARRASG